MSNCIFNLHCPPYDSGIDIAPKLNDELRPVLNAGQPVMIPVGSTAIKAAIGKYQPLLGLHGHVHESSGVVELGRTLCLNPGSEYGEGILRGILVDISNRRVDRYVRTEG
jgi:hypothetical protein